MGIQINGNTNNINAGIGSLSIEDINELDIVGVATAANFKTGVSNLHSVGLSLSGGQIDVGSNIKIGNAGVITATSFVGSGANLTGISGVSVANQADNRLITATGTTDALNGEANLTFNGTRLHAKGSGEILRLETTASGGGQCYIDFDDETATRASIGMRGSSSDTLTLAALNGSMRFDVQNKVQAMNITTDGHLLLGTNTDYADVNSDDLQIYGTSHTGMSITSGSSHYGSIYFGDATSGDSRNRGIVRYNHTANAMEFWTNAAEKVRIDTDGSLHIATGGSRSNVSNNADDIIIGSTGTSNETGISMFSTIGSGIRFNDASGTDGAIEYSHSARELRFNSAGNNRLQFGVNASNSPVFSFGTGHYSGDGNNHNKGDRASVKVGAYLHLESALGAGHNSRAGLGYNCYFHSTENFYCGSRSPSGGDNRPAAYGMAYGNHYFYSDASNTAHSAQAQLTMTKNMVIHRQGYVTKPNQPSFRAHDSNHAQNGFLTFDQIATNVGNHYNGSNGRFTAPVAGTYFFSFYGMLAASNQNGRVEYYINGSVHPSGEHYGGVAYTNNQTYNMITCNTVLTLSQNDYVNLNWNTSYNSMHSYHNGFMGFLIG